LRTIADQFLRARAGDIYARLGIAIHDLKRRHAEIIEDPGSNIDAALAVLANAGLRARAWEKHTHFQGGTLGAQNIERAHARENAGAQARGDGTSRNGFVALIRFAAHGLPSSLCGLLAA
jgi:hypothetical protein